MELSRGMYHGEVYLFRETRLAERLRNSESKKIGIELKFQKLKLKHIGVGSKVETSIGLSPPRRLT